MEQDTRACKRCGELKIRIHSGMYDNRTKKFVDDKGAHWNGRVCPECNKKRVKTSIKQLRDIRNG